MNTVIRCVVVGDTTVGKSSLIITFTAGVFPEEYKTRSYDLPGTSLMVNEVPVTLDIVDTASQEEYDQLRPLEYLQANVFLVCFSVVSPSSFNSVTAKWIPEIRKYCPNVPCVLVGMKTDLREDEEAVKELLEKHQRNPITREEGELKARELGATYMECSSLKRIGVDELFDHAVCVCPQIQGINQNEDHEKPVGGCTIC